MLDFYIDLSSAHKNVLIDPLI